MAKSHLDPEQRAERLKMALLGAIALSVVLAGALIFIFVGGGAPGGDRVSVGAGEPGQLKLHEYAPPARPAANQSNATAPGPIATGFVGKSIIDVFAPSEGLEPPSMPD